MLKDGQIDEKNTTPLHIESHIYYCKVAEILWLLLL